MCTLLSKNRIFNLILLILVAIFLFSIHSVWAENQKCSSVGYTILTINGIFTDKNEAKKNKDDLSYQLPGFYNNEPVVIDYLHNPPHLAGIGDVLKSIYQGLLDSETVEDYDLVKMLKTASEKVVTQKLLLVAHSQGNFYANSFYDTVADKAGGVPTESIGVYSVATPSGRVAGGGKWLTSDTDKVIAGVVGHVPFQKIMEPNTHIELQNGDDPLGHNFSGVYLKYQNDKIISDIKSSLGQLKTNDVQDAQKSCLVPPKLSIVHKIEGAVFAVADPIANAVFAVAQTAVSIGTKVVKAGAEKVVEVVQTIRETFSDVFKKDEFQLAQVIDLSQETQSSQSGQTSQLLSSKQCSFDTQKSPSHSRVIISEIAWMGGVNSANDEWVELKNISSGAVDLTGWQLIDKGEQIKIVFGKGSIISANGFYLLERTDDATVPEVKADVIYSGILSNSNEGIRLFDGECNLVDEASASPDWPAGDNKSRKTMERNSGNLNWHTSAVIGGTPKRENSTSAQTVQTEIKKPLAVQKETEEEDEKITLQQEEQIKQQEQIKQATSSPQQTANFKQCSFSTNQSALHQEVIINEVAWMGTVNSANDEWIELKNISGGEINLNGWQLIDQGEQIKITFENGNKISPAGFYLLERTDDNTVSNIAADRIYTGSLSNTNEGLRLFDSQCNLIDEVLANPDWSAGDNTAKKTMERKSDFSWYTSSIVGGTPKAENSQPTLIYSGGGGGGGGTPTNNQQQVSPSAKVIINEIMYDLVGADEGQEWIEIYNTGDFAVDLTNWKFYENQTNHGLTVIQGSATLPVGGYAVIVSDSVKFLADYPGYSGAILKSSFSLSNTGETIALKNGDSIIDEVTYSSDWGAKGDGKSLQKINGNWTASLPTPGQENILTSQSNQAPSAFFVYAPENPNVGDLITFNAASSTDSDGTISLFQWDFGNGQATTTQATTTYSYSTAGNYTIRLTVLDNQNASSTASSTIISVASGQNQTNQTNYLVISEIQVAGSKVDDEFIEIYNPTTATTSLVNWSIQYLSGTATSTEKIQKKNFSSDAQIPAKGFYLVVNSNATSSLVNKADMAHNSFSLSGNPSGAAIFLVSATTSISSISDSANVDSLSYGNPQLAVSATTSTVPDSNKSLERKAFSNGQCVSAQDDNEFLGNGCDTDSGSDFEIRNNPNPQNSQSLPEPRSAPTAPENFDIQYSSSTMKLIFNWTESHDYNNVTSTLTYKIIDISGASSTLTAIDTASTTAEISISEFGRSYNFSIIAIDKEGYESEKSEAAISVPQSSLIIAQQTNKSVFEIGTGNGQFYQLLGSGLIAEPKEVTFHAKFLSGSNNPAYYFNVSFWQSDKSDYSNPVVVSSNTCYRTGNYGMSYGITDGNCPDFGFEYDIDKNYVIPIQESFVFNPAKYYKMTIFTYQDWTTFYGSSDEGSYLYGKSTKDNGGGAEIDSSPVKDLYFIIPAKSAFEVPLKTSQLTPQNFALSYSSNTYEINFKWDEPRYLENSTSSLIYKIIDISATGSSLPNAETAATSTKISINEVGRNYKFSIQSFDENGTASLTDEKEIEIPHSLAEPFIIASQLEADVSERGTGNGQFYQTLGNGLIGSPGGITFHIKFLASGYYKGTEYINATFWQSDEPDYSNLTKISSNTCNRDYPGATYYDQNNIYGSDCPSLNFEFGIDKDYTIPIQEKFAFDPTKYYKLTFIIYQSTVDFYGSADENSYINGQATKDNGGGLEISPSEIKDLYFILTSRTPLR